MNTDDLTYEPVHLRPRQEIINLLNSDDPAEIAEALYSATYHDTDWCWVQSQCLRFLRHSELRVRWAAATCLGDLAVFHKKVDLDTVLPALHEAAKDSQIRSAVEDSLDLIHQNITTQ